MCVFFLSKDNSFEGDSMGRCFCQALNKKLKLRDLSLELEESEVYQKRTGRKERILTWQSHRLKTIQRDLGE